MQLSVMAIVRIFLQVSGLIRDVAVRDVAVKTHAIWILLLEQFPVLVYFIIPDQVINSRFYLGINRIIVAILALDPSLHMQGIQMIAGQIRRNIWLHDMTHGAKVGICVRLMENCHTC